MGKVLVVSIVLVVIVVIIAGYFLFLMPKDSGNENFDELNNILSGYKSCVETNDVECSCKYLYESYCQQNRERGSLDLENGEFEGFVLEHGSNPITIKEKIKEGTVTESNINNGKPTKMVLYETTYPIKESGYSINSVTFVEIDNQWKIYDFG